MNGNPNQDSGKEHRAGMEDPTRTDRKMNQDWEGNREKGSQGQSTGQDGHARKAGAENAYPEKKPGGPSMEDEEEAGYDSGRRRHGT